MSGIEDVVHLPAPPPIEGMWALVKGGSDGED
jgi:hypothetical protein